MSARSPSRSSSTSRLPSRLPDAVCFVSASRSWSSETRPRPTSSSPSGRLDGAATSSSRRRIVLSVRLGRAGCGRSRRRGSARGARRPARGFGAAACGDRCGRGDRRGAAARRPAARRPAARAPAARARAGRAPAARGRRGRRARRPGSGRIVSPSSDAPTSSASGSARSRPRAGSTSCSTCSTSSASSARVAPGRLGGRSSSWGSWRSGSGACVTAPVRARGQPLARARRSAPCRIPCPPGRMPSLLPSHASRISSARRGPRLDGNWPRSRRRCPVYRRVIGRFAPVWGAGASGQS